MDYIAESYKGISRIQYPNWEGWKEIDRHKKMHGFPDNLRFSNKLVELVNNLLNLPGEIKETGRKN